MYLLSRIKPYFGIILYGIALAILLVLLKWLEYRYLIQSNTIEIYIGLIAILFTVLGIWVGGKIIKPKTEIKIVKEEVLVPVSGFDAEKSKKVQEQFGITKREFEILTLITKGLSNDEIAKTLFISVSSVKTLISRLFSKLDVERRTQAIQKAKETGLIS
ncbi:MAG: LuxR C-terminal-related transcriptional regulator [Chitinophagales bacterium]